MHIDNPVLLLVGFGTMLQNLPPELQSIRVFSRIQERLSTQWPKQKAATGNRNYR